jgi:AraC-like DNA-binding protein
MVQTMTLTASDVDEATAILGSLFYPTFLEPLSSPARLQAHFEITPAGPLTIGDLRFGVDVKMRCGELGAYHVDVPISGELVWSQGSSEPRLATTTTAALFQPVGDTTIDRWDADCRLLAVKIDRGALETELACMLDAPIKSPVRLRPLLDVSSGAGASWVRLLEVMTADAAQPNGLGRHPLLARSLQQNLITGLLLASDHQYSEQLHHQRPALAAPRAVRRVMDAVQADPGRPFTVADLADIAGVSRRSLQDSFKRYVGTSPMTYLRQVRLAHVHDELRRADASQTTISEIAYRGGFPHLGRFAALYRARYGVSPSQTLRD